MFLLDSVSNLAHNTVLGVASICGNGSAALSDAPQMIFTPNVVPLTSISALDSNAYPALPFGTGDLQRSPAADAGFIPIPQSNSNQPGKARFPSRTSVAVASDTVSEIREPGTEIPMDSAGDEDTSKNLNQIQETLLSRGGLTFSGGYSSVEGPNLEARIARRNIGGFNREMTASARYSKTQTLFEVGYADGDFLGSSITFAPTLFTNGLTAKGFGNGPSSTPFKQTARGINFHFNRKFDSGIAATANYRLSDDSFRIGGSGAICDNGIFGSPICGALGKATSSILSLALTLDRRDSATDPTRGFKLRLTQDLAGLGGTTRYMRTRFGGGVYIGIAGDWNLALGAEGGFIAPIGKATVPLFDRFYIGGTSMRGFDLRGIGPKVVPSAAGPGQNVAIGGRAYYSARAELSVPIGGFLGNYGLQTFAFVDAGSVFGAKSSGLLPSETLIGNSAKPRVAVGIGLALNTPAGKLRIDFAKPIVKQFGDRSKMLSISFGAAI
jgi:outer membrane protein assembly factor BamA